MPQIAAKGSAHYYVYKIDRCYNTSIKKLTEQGAADGMARMLSGAEKTPPAGFGECKGNVEYNRQ